jgi:hypothetical protein
VYSQTAAVVESKERLIDGERRYNLWIEEGMEAGWHIQGKGSCC